MKRFALALLIPLATTACQEIQAPEEVGAPQFAAAAAAHDDLALLWGPQQFVRGQGAPVTETVIVTNPHFAGFGAPFFLNLQNGDYQGGNRVSEAVVTLDGVEIFGPSDFSQQVGELRAAVTVSEGSQLTVRLASIPGSHVTLWIEGTPRSVTFVVNTADDGFDGLCDEIHCSLREALDASNWSPGHDVIAFGIPGDGVHTIRPEYQLPLVVDPVVIDGYTQPGASPNTNPWPSGLCTELMIELDGSLAGPAQGLHVFAGLSTVRGLVINRFTFAGIKLEGNGGNVVEGNFIGTDASGTEVLPNGEDGVTINSSENLVGGTAPEARNLLSGNFSGVFIRPSPEASANIVQGNLIGTDVMGTVALGNLDGVTIESGHGNTVGGTAYGAGNVISGNERGVRVEGSEATDNVVLGNFIGTDVSGTAAIGGVVGVFVINAPGNTIGGSVPGARNVISGNVQGVAILEPEATGNRVLGNYIGTDVSGTAAIGGEDGVFVENAPGNTIGGTVAGAGNVISGNRNNVFILNAEATGNTVLGNYIGTDWTGTAALGGVIGVLLLDAPGNIVGGTTPAARNLISGHTDETGNGIVIGGVEATGNVVQGNYIGTDVTGTVAIPNIQGAGIINAAGNAIGGSGPGEGNVLSGNEQFGIFIEDAANDNVVLGNLIGTDASGTAPLGNRSGVGIFSGSTNNTVGGASEGARNVISSSVSNGVIIGSGASDNLVQGNYIGTDITGFVAFGNRRGVAIGGQLSAGNVIGGLDPGAGNVIAHSALEGVGLSGAAGLGNGILSNSIFSNAGLGIDLRPSGVTPNDPGDGDSGPNDLQNFPVLTSADEASGLVEGTLNSAPDATFRIEFFTNAECDPSDHGEGETLLGWIDVATDGAGDASFGIVLPLSGGAFVTSTATDSGNNTSEFSACAPVG